MRELEDLLQIETQLLVAEPDSFAYQLSQLSIPSLELRREELLGIERIPLRYVGTLPDDVAQLLGPTGLTILGHISDLIKSAALERGWPLEALEVRWQTDPEIERMGNIILVLRLRTSFDRAYEIFKSLFPEIERLVGNLGGDARSVLAKRIYFDVKAL